MKIVINIDQDYYEIIKYDVDKGMAYLPCVLIANGIPLKEWLETFNTDSATECFTAVQELKRGLNNEQV